MTSEGQHVCEEDVQHAVKSNNIKNFLAFPSNQVQLAMCISNCLWGKRGVAVAHATCLASHGAGNGSMWKDLLSFW